MQDKNKTKKQLIDELASSRLQIKKLEKSESELKQAEEALQESEGKYRTLVTSIPVVTWITDNKGNTSFISPNIKEVYGFSPEEIYSEGDSLWFGRIHPDDIEQVKEAYERLFTGEGKFDIEYRIQRKDGQWIYSHDKAIATYKEEGVMYGYGVFEDITERMQAEKALQESQHLISSVFESIQDGISILAPDLTIRQVNNLMKEWYAENLPLEGKKCYEVYQNRNTPCDSCPMLRCMKSGKTERDIVPGLPGSAVEWIELFSYPMKDPETGKINGAVEFVRNITDWKKAEEALQASEAKYRSIFKNTGTATAIIEADMTMSLVNSEMEKLTGFSKKEIENKKKWMEFVLKEDLARMKKYHVARRNGGGEAPKRYEARLVNRAGEVRQGLLIVDMIPGTKQSVISLLDITDRKQAEKKIKASLKEKEVMLQEIHHRVKNNMQIVVSLLRLQSYTAKDKKIEDMFKVAQSRIRSMAIIHEKLYKSKDFAVIDFAHYIRSLTTHLMQTYQIDPKQITLKTDVKDIHLDINQGVPVGLLINELVSNALKHAFPKGKKGEIIVKFHADKKGKKTLIVSDNGIGHPDKVDMSKPETLGLQLIKDLTKQIGGKLDLENKAGTTFKITFT